MLWNLKGRIVIVPNRMKKTLVIAVALFVGLGTGAVSGVAHAANSNLSEHDRIVLQSELDALKGTLLQLQTEYAVLAPSAPVAVTPPEESGTVWDPTELSALKDGLDMLEVTLAELQLRVEAGAVPVANRAAIAVSLGSLGNALAAIGDSMTPTVAQSQSSAPAAESAPIVTQAQPPVPQSNTDLNSAPGSAPAAAVNNQALASEAQNAGPNGMVVAGIVILIAAVIAIWFWRARAGAKAPKPTPTYPKRA